MTRKMSLIKSLLLLNPSSFYVATFGVSVFIAGYYSVDLYNWFSKQDSAVQRILGGIALATPPGLVKLVDVRISEDKKQAVEDERINFENDIKKQNDIFKGYIDNIFELLRNEEFAQSLPKEIHEKIRVDLQQLAALTHHFYEDREQAKELVRWLDETIDGQAYGNRYKLIYLALNAANVDSHILKEFDVDIRNCIQWLHDSFADGTPCKLDRFQASTLFSGKLSPEPYILALNAIRESMKNEQALSTLSAKDRLIDYMIHNLIEKIKKLYP